MLTKRWFWINEYSYEYIGRKYIIKAHRQRINVNPKKLKKNRRYDKNKRAWIRKEIKQLEQPIPKGKLHKAVKIYEVVIYGILTDENNHDEYVLIDNHNGEISFYTNEEVELKEVFKIIEERGLKIIREHGQSTDRVTIAQREVSAQDNEIVSDWEEFLRNKISSFKLETHNTRHKRRYIESPYEQESDQEKMNRAWREK